MLICFICKNSDVKFRCKIDNTIFFCSTECQNQFNSKHTPLKPPKPTKSVCINDFDFSDDTDDTDDTDDDHDDDDTDDDNYHTNDNYTAASAVPGASTKSIYKYISMVPYGRYVESFRKQ